MSKGESGSLRPFSVAAAEAEEGDVEDALPAIRAKCAEKKDCQLLKTRLEECNERVSAKAKTTEKCHEEMIDFMNCVEHCAAPLIWHKLK